MSDRKNVIRHQWREAVGGANLTWDEKFTTGQWSPEDRPERASERAVCVPHQFVGDPGDLEDLVRIPLVHEMASTLVALYRDLTHEIGEVHPDPDGFLYFADELEVALAAAGYSSIRDQESDHE